MKKLLAAATALSGFLALAGAASAADPGVVDPGYDWSGFYLGVNAGVAFGETNGSQSLDPVQNNANASAIAIINNTNNDSYSSTDFTGGLTLGYNQQMDSLVLGIEGDVNFMDLSGSKNSTFTAGATGRGEDSTSADFLATARLRLGYAMDRSLFYVTGGAAFTDAKA
ncbi:MAG: outer membrane protein, partial [Methylocella sp.]